MKNILLPHNIPVYAKVEEAMDRLQSALLETATGTGKSYIGAEFIKAHGGTWLVFVPTIALQDVWEELGRVYGLTISTMTYQGYAFLAEEDKEAAIEKYDGFILDEAHHIGADGWSQVAKDIRGSGKPYLGLTAGSRRFTDNQDVADVYFDTKVNGYTLGQAIGRKILPTFQYVSVLFSFPKFETEDLGHIKQSAYEKLKSKLEFLVENQYSIHRILDKHLGTAFHKIIVFVECVEDIPKAEECLKGIVKEENIFHVNYTLGKERNADELRQFKSCKESAAVINVSILMEGFHIKDVDTMIMLRRTESPRVFFQQLGRIASPENMEKRLLAFDFVGNSTSVRYYENETRDAIMEINQEIPDKERQIIVTDYSREAISVIHEIESLLGLGWSEEEDNVLRKYYPLEGMDAARHIPGRSREACKGRARILGIKAPDNSWTEEEDDILRQYYPSEGRSVSARIPGRNPECCKARALKLGLKSSRLWTEEELEILKKYYPLEGPKVSERLPGRNPASCTTKANKLGLQNTSRQWSQEHLSILREMYPKVGDDIVKYLPFTLQACRAKANKLGVRKFQQWTEEQEEILKKNYPVYGAAKCAELTGHTVSSCQRKAVALGVRMKESPLQIAWTKEEDDILRKYYPAEGVAVTKRLPGRTNTACRAHALKLGLNVERNRWTEEYISILTKMYPIVGKDIVDYLPFSLKACQTKAHDLGLKVLDLYWTKEQVAILKEKYPKMGTKVIEYLPFSASACRTKAQSLGIKLEARKPWTEEEIRILKEKYPVVGKDIINYVPHPLVSCRTKAKALGLKPGNN